MKRLCRVKHAGGVLHFFAVGQVFEQPSVDWLKETKEGHPVGNHTYDHVNVTAIAKDVFRFQRALVVAWPVGCRFNHENIVLMNKAMKTRLELILLVSYPGILHWS